MYSETAGGTSPSSVASGTIFSAARRGPSVRYGGSPSMHERCLNPWATKMGRHRVEGELGLLDRSSAPKSIPRRTKERRIEAIAALRRLRFTGPEIAETLRMALSTVSGILTRIGMGRLGRLGLEPARRYERQRPGELIHIDVKNSGGSSAAPGTASTVTNAATRPGPILPDEGAARSAGSSCTSRSTSALAWPTPRCSPTRRATAVAFLGGAVAFYKRYGMSGQQLLTDSGSGYRSMIHMIACRALGIRHLRTRAP
jgi:hypothetical protein